MAENEVKKERAKVNISIWFLIFIVYLIFSLAYIFNQNSTIENLKMEVATLNSKIESTVNLSNAQSNAIIIQLENVIKELRDATIVKEDETPVVLPSTEVSVGTYNGSTEDMQMTLTLSENNVASVSTNQSGDMLDVNGTYMVAVDSVIFTSDDAMTHYTFTVNADGSLNLVGSELTLSK